MISKSRHRVTNPKLKGAAVDPGLGDGPAGDLAGVTRQDVHWLTAADRTSTFRRLQATRTGGFGSVMSRRWPRNVIVVIKATERFAGRCERLPLGPGYRSVVTLLRRSGVSLHVFTVREREGS